MFQVMVCRMLGWIVGKMMENIKFWDPRFREMMICIEILVRRRGG